MFTLDFQQELAIKAKKQKEIINQNRNTKL